MSDSEEATILYLINEEDAHEFIGFSPGRPRGAWVEHREGNQIVIVVTARVGGGNMPHYQETWRDAFRHEWHRSATNDEFDSTYANFEFSVPEERHAELWELIRQRGEEAEHGQ